MHTLADNDAIDNIPALINTSIHRLLEIVSPKSFQLASTVIPCLTVKKGHTCYERY